MTDRHGNKFEGDEEEQDFIEGKKCPVDDEIYSSYLDRCPIHDEPLVPIDPEEDGHLL